MEDLIKHFSEIKIHYAHSIPMIYQTNNSITNAEWHGLLLFFLDKVMLAPGDQYIVFLH